MLEGNTTSELFNWLTIAEALLQLSMIVMIGLYFIFSNTIMHVLAKEHDGASIMNKINSTILNPVFLTCFFVSGLASMYFFYFGSGAKALSGLFFFMGTTVVTVVFNVPLNNKLKAAQKESMAPVWAEYLSKWVLWNHCRTAAGIVSGFLMSL
jgi:uncharacterized membrane protein